MEALKTKPAVITSDIRRLLKAHLESSCKPRRDWRIGLEFEQIALQAQGSKPLPFSGEVSVTTLFNQLQRQFGWQPIEVEGHVIALKRGEDNITLEPGGQVEFSSRPSLSLCDLRKELERWLRERGELPIAGQLQWLATGLNPLYKPDDVHWMPKGRYQIMRERFRQVGTMGAYMMALTTALQVSLDYLDEADCLFKVRTSLALSPIFTAIFAVGIG